MNKKKTISIIALSFLALLLIGGIVGLIIRQQGKETIANAENVYEYDYHSFCSYAHDDYMNIDGVLDESAWDGKKWFENTYLANVNDNMARMKLTAFCTDYGIYIASVVNDTNIRDDGQRSPGLNSNWEFYLAADDVGEEKAADGLYRYRFSIQTTGEIYTTFPNFDRAVVVDGEVNSGNTKSATLEMFVPWETISIDKSKGIPTEFGILPAWRGVLEGQSETSLLSPISFPINGTKDFYRFDADGYVYADRENSVVGDSKFGHAKTGNWDTSKEADGIVESSFGTEHHKIYFSEHYAKNFIVEATIIPVKSLENDYPKAGIYFQGTDGMYHTVFLDMGDSFLTDGPNKTKNFNKYSLVTLNNEDGKWNQRTYSEALANANANKKEGVKLTVIKLNGKFWYFCDGNFIFSEEHVFMDIDTIPGFYSLGAHAIYKDYSCSTITEDEVINYLNEKGLYYVDASVASAGGNVSTSTSTIKKGAAYDIEMITKSGYEVSSVTINGKEKISDVKKQAVAGVYTVKNVKANQEVKVEFAKCDGKTVQGSIKSGKENIAANVVLTGQSNRALRYEVAATGTKGYAVSVPVGTYTIHIESDGYKPIERTIKITKDTTQNFTLSLSDFAETVKINDKNVNSLVSCWDMSKEHLSEVSTSYEDGGKMAPLYFTKTAKDFVVETTLDYTTVFENGKEYQPDLMGGFVFHDGINREWIVARGTGVVYTGWKFIHNLVDYDMLTYPSKKSVTFSLAKSGNDVYIYFNGVPAAKMNWSDIAPSIDANSEMAIGLYMVADKTADIKFSNYSLKTGAAVSNYIKTHVIKDGSLEGSSVFANALTVNGIQLKSMVSRWDLSGVSKNVVTGSYNLGTKLQPLYFNLHGNNAIMQTTIEYTTVFENGKEYQPDLMGGFAVSDGTNAGWIVADKTGICYTNWKFDQGLIKEPILSYPTKKSVELTVALKNGYFYVFFDDVYVARKKVSAIVPGATSATDLAFGLCMIADKTADIKFSNTSISTDASDVEAYISANK